MVDITRDEIWENSAQEVEKFQRHNTIKSFVGRNKIITTLLITLAIFMTTNIILIYRFLTILSNI